MLVDRVERIQGMDRSRWYDPNLSRHPWCRSVFSYTRGEMRRALCEPSAHYMPGKTMLASLVIDHLKESLSSGSSGVIYIFCDYRMQQEQTLSGLIASLLKQILQQQQVIPTDLKEACQGYIRAGTRPKLQEMLNMLQTAMESFSRTYVIIDALDELSSQNQVRQNLLKELRGLQDVYRYNLLITSRHITNLILEFPEPLCLEIRASSEDVRRYVYGHMTHLPNCVRTDMGLQESIASSIVAAVDGMYAQFLDSTGIESITKLLNKVPSSSAAS